MTTDGKLRSTKFDISNKESIRFRLEHNRVIHPNGCWTYMSNPLYRHTELMFGYKKYGLHVISAYAYLDHSLSDPLMALHKCGNAGCFNPDHLYKGNEKDNMRDCIEHGTFPASNKTHCKHGHKYEFGSYRMRRGWRECYACIRDLNNKRKAIRRQGNDRKN